MDSTGVAFQGPGSWFTIRFHKNGRRRDHRKLSLLMETRQFSEKFIHSWRLDTSRTADVKAGRALIDRLPPKTRDVSGDTAYDAYDVYDRIEQQGAKSAIKPRSNAKTGTIDARGRSLRERLRRPTAWQRRYDRRPILESGNYALKRRFGARLSTRGLHRHRKESGYRIIAYNTNMVKRALVRRTVPACVVRR